MSASRNVTVVMPTEDGLGKTAVIATLPKEKQ
jgi:hypothetical protein